MNIYQYLVSRISEGIKDIFGVEPEPSLVRIEPTNPDYKGDITLVVFPLLKLTRKPPADTARVIGEWLVNNAEWVQSFEVIQGFLNLFISTEFWIQEGLKIAHSGKPVLQDLPQARTFLIEYSSPNTNKPLHLGHIRNNLIGHSLAELLKTRGHKVIKANLINDRGIHICKSMLAWMKWGHNETPESSGMKGDFLIGKYYVLFEKKYREEIKQLQEQGLSKEEAEERSTLLYEAKELLRKWENNDPEVRNIWKTLNSWTLAGFDATYKRMGISFDKIYFESETYLLGKNLVKQGLEKGVFYQKEDGSVWCSLKDENLDEKILLRSDGTSVYITQDLGTAELKYQDFHPDVSIYVVGNEQDYHFTVLKKILQKLKKPYADTIFHLSYGMVELPEGKMKSREGKVVDADDLMDKMQQTALDYIKNSGKLEETDMENMNELAENIGQAAIKFFILKTDIRKNIVFNPEESIDFQGFTGPFVQYTHARICSVLRKSGIKEISALQVNPDFSVNEEEKDVLVELYNYENVLSGAEKTFDVSSIAHYAYQLAKKYNRFYHDYPILKEQDNNIRNFRLQLSYAVSIILRDALRILGILAPDKM